MALRVPGHGGPVETVALVNRDRLSYLVFCLICAGSAILLLVIHLEMWAAVFATLAIVGFVLTWRPNLNLGMNTVWRRTKK
jgi:hypothetical protein